MAFCYSSSVGLRQCPVSRPCSANPTAPSPHCPGQGKLQFTSCSPPLGLLEPPRPQQQRSGLWLCLRAVSRGSEVAQIRHLLLHGNTQLELLPAWTPTPVSHFVPLPHFCQGQHVTPVLFLFSRLCFCLLCPFGIPHQFGIDLFCVYFLTFRNYIKFQAYLTDFLSQS